MNLMNTKIGQWTYKNRSKILTGAGIASMWGMTVYAVMQTPKAMKAIEKKKEELNTDKLTWLETVKATWMYYLGPFCIGAGGTTMVGISDSVQQKTIGIYQTSLALAEVAEVAADEFKERVKERLGEEEAKKIETEVHQALAEKKYRDNGDVCNIYSTGEGELLFYENTTSTFFRSSYDSVSNAYISFKNGLNNSNGLPWNDWLQELGLYILPVGYTLGYNPNWKGIELDLGQSIICPATGEAAIVVDIGVLPKPDYK